MKDWYVEFGLSFPAHWEHLVVQAETAQEAAAKATPEMDKIMLRNYGTWAYEIKTPKLVEELKV